MFGAGSRIRTADLLITLPLQLSLPFVCGLDFLFTLARALGVRRQVSTPSLSGLARDCHFTGFPEFDGFYSTSFPVGTRISSELLWPSELIRR